MRITRVYTGAGDQGMTRLGDGSKVPKDHPRVIAYGSVDLANSFVGCVRAELNDPELDAILEEFVEKDKTVKEIIEKGFPREVVKEVARMVDRNEYKRRQAPPGIKITSKAFGKDRRMPITNRYKT